VHLVGFTIEIYHDVRPYKIQIKELSPEELQIPPETACRLHLQYFSFAVLLLRSSSLHHVSD